MPFLKWMGGKSQVLHIFKDYFPDFYNVKGYIEPFIGGGSVYFYIMENYKGALEGKPILISDINKELINCYKVVRDNVDDVIPLLEKHQKLNCEEYYYRVREIYPPGDDMNVIEKAAAFIYLSRAAFGGLWRVNSEGKMNAPFNKNPAVKIMDDDLYQYSGLLKLAKINVMSFENVLKFKSIEGYFVYLDPPYADTGQGAFTGYSKDGYHAAKRDMLPKVFKELDKRGAKVMMSNADVPAMRSYFSDFYINVIKTNRQTGIQLSSITKDKIDNTGKLNEVVVTNYRPVKKQITIDEAWIL